MRKLVAGNQKERTGTVGGMKRDCSEGRRWGQEDP